MSKKLEIVKDSGSLSTKAPQSIPLTRLEHCRGEMAAVYRLMRSGKMEPHHGTKLVFVLAAIAKLIVESDLEQRIEKLETEHEKTKHEGKHAGRSNFI
jgi:hypothetical protein